MAAGAERHQIRLVVRSTIPSGCDVVGDLRFGELPAAPAQNAEGVLGQEGLAHLAPGVSVAPAGKRIASIAFVGSRSLYRMLLTIPSVG